MQWLARSCYAGSIVLYLFVKYYYEHECKYSAETSVGDGDDNCACAGLSYLIFSLCQLIFYIKKKNVFNIITKNDIVQKQIIVFF